MSGLKKDLDIKADDINDCQVRYKRNKQKQQQQQNKRLALYSIGDDNNKG